MFFPHVPGEGLLLLNGHCRTFQLRAPDLSWHSGTSTASAGIKWALTELNRELQSSRAPDLQIRTSTASSRSQCALPDFNCELQIGGTAGRAIETSVGTAGPQPRALDLNDHCRASTASSRSQLALPDLNDLSGHCRTSTASSRFQWALPDLNREIRISVGTLDLNCKRRIKWALTELNRELQISVGIACRTSTTSQISVRAAGPQRSQWALLDLDCERRI